MPKLMYIVTVPNTARAFLRGQIEAMKEAGFDVSVASSPTPVLQEVSLNHGIEVFRVPMAREIKPFQDVRALWQLVKLLREQTPDIINAGTPKAGLLGMVAAWLARVPVRIYQLRGLRLETTSGPKRLALGITERITSRCAHKIVCNSESLRKRYLDLNLAPASKLIVLGHGSSNGINPERFLPNPTLLAEAEQLRHQLDIPDNAHILGYVGRFTKDKGIVELIEAYVRVSQVYPETYLLLIGKFEDGDPVPATTREQIFSDERIRLIGYVKDTAVYYQIMDFLIFPSYREGLPNVPLEAAMAGIPTVGFNATGVVDAVKHGETGLLAPLYDSDALTEAVLQLLNDPELRDHLGKKAQQWALAHFNQVDVWQRWVEFYYRCLENRTSTND